MHLVRARRGWALRPRRAASAFGAFGAFALVLPALVLFACANGSDSGGLGEGGAELPDGSRDVFVVPTADEVGADGPLPLPDSSGCTGKVVINELKTAGTTASDEMIELYNPSSCAVPLGDWQLKYQSFSGGGTNVPMHKFAVGDSILAGAYVVLTPGGNPDLMAGMAADKGQVGLLDDKGKLVDAVAYGAVTAGNYREGQSAPSPPANGSIGRKPNGADTDDNNADFKVYASTSQGVANP